MNWTHVAGLAAIAFNICMVIFFLVPQLIRIRRIHKEDQVERAHYIDQHMNKIKHLEKKAEMLNARGR